MQENCNKGNRNPFLSLHSEQISINCLSFSRGCSSERNCANGIIETLDAKMQDGRPYGVNRWYKLSLHEKSALYRDLDTWKGGITNEELAGLDLTKMLGVNCVLNIVHSNKGKARVKAVHRLDDSVVLTVNEAFTFDIDTYVSDDNEEEVKKVALMSEYWVDKIETSLEVEAWKKKNPSKDEGDLESLKAIAEDGEVEDGDVKDNDIPF